MNMVVGQKGVDASATSEIQAMSCRWAFTRAELSQGKANPFFPVTDDVLAPYGSEIFPDENRCGWEASPLHCVLLQQGVRFEGSPFSAPSSLARTRSSARSASALKASPAPASPPVVPPPAASPLPSRCRFSAAAAVSAHLYKGSWMKTCRAAAAHGRRASGSPP